MMKKSRPTLASTLLPGTGYFSTFAGDPLVVTLAGAVRRLRLQLDAGAEPHLLNLQGISFHEGGELVNPVVATTLQSSVYKDDPRYGPDTLLTGKGIHTNSEPSPWWELDFAEPLQASEVRIANRRDQWGRRARSLRVLQQSIQGEWSVLHDSQSTDEQLANLLAAARLTAGRWEFTDGPPSTQREELIRAAVGAVLSAETDLSVVPWRRVLALVDLWGGGALTDEESVLLAARLYRSNGLDPIFAFSAKLTTRKSIHSLQANINSVASGRGSASYVITRHGVQRSRLLSDAKAYLDAMRNVMEILAAAGRSPMLAYGTLLGAVRDKTFIPHDDDVDILYRSEVTSREGAERDLTGVQELLAGHGFQVRQLLPNLNMHVHDLRRKVIVDIFPCWDVEGRTYLHMERMAIRSIDSATVFPVSEVELYGQRFAAPAKPEAFLHERYGEGWPVSNPFFEWPWPLND